MILWCDGGHSPAENMARDTSLLAAAELGHEPVLRLSRFEPHGITLGASQRPERELDLERCTRDGIPWARRPTGGRAIFHAAEWTYALAAPIADPAWGGDRATSYARLSALLVAALVRLGVPAILAEGHPRARLEPGIVGTPGGGPAPPCFASTARHEVVLEGRKLIGSAQRRTARALLQQGSLLLGDGHCRLADYLAIEPSRRERVRLALGESATHAGRWLGPAPPLERWADALMRVLPGDVRRRDDVSILPSLTLESGASYTGPAANAPSGHRLGGVT